MEDKRDGGRVPQHGDLYPVQKVDTKQKKRSGEEILSQVLSDKFAEKAKRRSSAFAITVQHRDPNRRGTSTAKAFLSDWRAVSIQATVEKKMAVQQMDSVLKNFQMGVYEQAKQAKNLNIKCMWLFLVIVMHALLVYELSRRTVQYYYNPAITTFTLHTPKSIDFPQVYICMAASANRTFMLEHPTEFTLSNRFRERVVINRKKRQASFESTEDHDQDLLVSVPEIQEYLSKHNSLLNRVRRESEHQHGRLSYVTNQSDISTFNVYDFFHDAGYKLEETFLECSFGGTTKRKLDCKKIIEPILDINYGLCYAVNLDGTKQISGGAGLTLILHSHVELYPTDDVNAPRSSGIYVSVSNGSDPTNWLKACAAPGQYVKIDVRSTRVQMMNLKSGSLIQPCVEDSDIDHLLQIFNATYTRTACQLDCMLREFRDQCQCILLADKRVVRSDVVAEATFCSPNRSHSCIVPRVTRNKTAMANMDRCRSSCHTPCNSWRFDMRTSVARLNPPAFSRFGLLPNVTAQNLIRIDVSYPKIEYGELVQSPSLTPAILISDIGGLMNLWINSSLVTLVGTFAIFLKFCIWKMSR